jgi:hypothetical protein
VKKSLDCDWKSLLLVKMDELTIKEQTTAMLQLVREGEYNGVIKRCITHGNELTTRDLHSDTVPLFEVIAKMESDAGWCTPLEVIQAMTQAAPESVGILCTDPQSRHKISPLIMSFRVDAPPNVQLNLLTKFPEAARMMSGDGIYPLFYASSFGYGGGAGFCTSEQVLKALVDANPAAVLHRKMSSDIKTTHLTPLDFLSEIYDLKHTIMEDDAWKYLIMFLEASALHAGILPVGQRADSCAGGYTPLHIACRLNNFNGTVIRCLAMAFPEWVCQRDLCGNTPLHYAAKAPAYKAFVERRGYSENDYVWSCVLDLLLEHHSSLSAAMTTSRGRVPLSIALESGKGMGDGVRKLLDAYPAAVEIVDTKTRMYPFMIAAACVLEEESNIVNGDVAQLEIIYELLLLSPNLVQPSNGKR